MLTQNDVIDGTTHPVDVRVDAVLKSITEFFITQSFDEFEQMKDCVNFMMLYSKNDGFEYIRVGRFFGRVAPFRNRSCEVKKRDAPWLRPSHFSFGFYPRPLRVTNGASHD